jgi:IS605 OrfB family transposase
VNRFTARDGWTMQAYRFALDPSPAQERALWSHCGAARLAFNWGLAQVKAVMDQTAAEASCGIAAQDLAPAISWTLPALRKAWDQAKDQVAPWWGENSKEAYNTGLGALARALSNWNESRAGRRKGPKIGFPRYKSRRKSTPAVRFTTGVIRIEPGRRHVTLPRLGTIRTHENTRKLQRRLAGGTARILSATVRRDRGGRWHVAFQAEVERAAATPARPDAVAGADLGIKHLAVIGTGAGRHHVVDNPRHLEDALGGLRRAGRVLSRRAGPVVYDPVTGAKTFRQPSAGWLEAKNALARAHARVARLRADALRKLTTTLARTYGTIVVEDLNVAGMLRNPKLARHLAGASFGEIRRQLDYKTGWNGGRLVVADRWYPSSKTCSACQTVKTKLSLSVRVFTCEHCGLVLDRDVNAARNLAALAAISGPGAAGPAPPGGNARRADQKTRPRLAGGDETGTVHAPHPRDGKTRTVARKGRLTEVH